MITIRAASAQDLPTIAAVLARAFQDDPVNLWMYPDERRRAEILPRLFHAFATWALPFGEVAVDADGLGAAIAFPPDRIEPDQAIREWLKNEIKAAAGEYARSGPFTLARIFGPLHPDAVHHYIQAVGVAPDAQGKGIGGALLKHLLSRYDAEAMPAYLEASSPRNRALYERLGFIERDTIELPDGPTVTTMWRGPESHS